MTGCVHTSAEDSGGHDGTYFSSFIRDHYASRAKSRDFVSALPDEVELLTLFLREKRGRAVTIRRPQPGSKKALLELAMTNADRALTRRALSRGSDPHVLEQTLMLLGRLVGLDRLPFRIEAYDVSHHGKERGRALWSSFNKANLREVVQALFDQRI